MKKLRNTQKKQVGMFIDPSLLPPGAEDPDYRLKRLQQLYGNGSSIGCSKCHHCRGI